jgi:hypothetical protein
MKKKDTKPAAGRGGRRAFLVGLLTGGGAVAALSGASGVVAPAPSQTAGAPEADPRAPILYRRTDHVERYYRTLYS